MAKRKQSYKVGYKRPPHAAQFKRGQSGNPKGRPKGSGLTKVAHKEASRYVYFTENGVRKKARINEFIIRETLAKAATGDSRARSDAFRYGLLGDIEEAQSDAGEAHEVFGGPEDQLVMASIVRRIRSMDEPPDGETEDAPEAPKPLKTPQTED